MAPVTGPDRLAEGRTALAAGNWAQARAAFDDVLADAESAEALFGSANALWWLGESHACVDRARRAYTLFRRSGDIANATYCAVWLAITYKSNFANATAANGWIRRAGGLLAPGARGPLV